ncbi:hypothetical protein [Saccharopolyspora thermophila]|uniref:SIR2-like domain-containing protein n=1 Tax=Saccharopolyspora thermophila TaxID=89367 RepID=A0ABP3MYM0_9PSEU
MADVDEFVRDVLGPVDVEQWRNVAPTELGSLRHGEPAHAAARALKYARLAGTSYDEIGYRSLAATPTAGHVPLQTFTQARFDAVRARHRALPPQLATLLEQSVALRHRPLAMPDGRLSYTRDDQALHLVRHDEPEVVWSFPLAGLPDVLLDGTGDRDAPQLVTQQYRVDLPGMYWLPLPALIRAAAFPRMQQCRGELVPHTEPGNFYCFLSHRWLTPTMPDPDGRQARLVAWQLFAAVCEAVHVAHRRGLHTPRRYHAALGSVVGLAGSELAESLIVNVLRHRLDADGVAAVHAEVEALQEITADRGLRAARDDADLARLRAMLTDRPLLRSLLDRVHLWYDYSCLPQEPRTPAEQEEFEQGLRRLAVLQVLGRTAVLLDDADDYLTRAWCTLEVLTAHASSGFDVLVGSHRTGAASGSTEDHLVKLVQDRPHVVWRAVLDTEVFGVQTPAECLARLDLAATRAADLPIVYSGLLDLGAPTAVHIDGSEVVTGTFPLPVVGGDTIVVPVSSGRPPGGVPPTSTSTLDWTGALRSAGTSRGSRQAIASFLRSDGSVRRHSSGNQRGFPGSRTGVESCHAVVIGSCEGEAVLLTDWVLDHVGELETAVGAPVTSLSWLASDVAPVGHFARGVLATAAVDAAQWVLISIATRFERCQMTNFLVNALLAGQVPFATVSLDQLEDNVVHYAPPHERDGSGEVVRVPAQHARMAAWRGGLFRDHVAGEFQRVVAGGHR